MQPSRKGNRLPERLTRNSEFGRVTRSGKRTRYAFLRLFHAPVKPSRSSTEKPAGRVGFVIPARFIKSAVKRNRVRRLLRETVRHWWEYIRPGFDIVLKVDEFPQVDHLDYVEAVILKLLLKASLLTDEGDKAARSRLADISPDTGRGREVK